MCLFLTPAASSLSQVSKAPTSLSPANPNLISQALLGELLRDPSSPLSFPDFGPLDSWGGEKRTESQNERISALFWTSPSHTAWANGRKLTSSLSVLKCKLGSVRRSLSGAEDGTRQCLQLPNPLLL